MWQEKNKPMNERLGLIEFTEYFMSNIDSHFISSEIHLAENQNFYEDAVFKVFDVYQRSEVEYSISDLVKIFHCFLWSLFKNKPSLEKNDDEILLHI